MSKCDIFRTLCLLLLLSTSSQAGAADGNGPTMGWSSWNTYGVNINEALIKRQAAAMVSKGLKNVGYDHINIDDGYFGGRDADGHLLIHPTRFPNGLKGVVDYIHTRGLKAGIYSDAGRNTCGSMFNGDAIGKGVGLYGHDQQDCDFFFNELGFDFIKVDFCGGSYYHNEDHLVLDERERYTAIAEAIKNTGRTDVRMNACRWAYPGTWISDVAFSWRTTGDIYDGWNSVRDIIKENLYLSAYCHDGHYNDMDMLEVGRSMTTEEDKTHFGMWCIMSSPLLIGCDLGNIKTTALTLLKNKDLIALNQDSLHLQAYVCQRQDDCYVLVKDIEQLHGLKRAFAVYNPSDKAATVQVSFASMDLGGTIQLHDCFKRQDAGTAEGTFSVTLPAHGTAIYTATAEQRLERRLYEAETAFMGNYQELVNNQTLPSGICEEADYASGGVKAGWLGRSEANDLQWRDVYCPTGGEFRLTIGYISGEPRPMQLTINGMQKKVFNDLYSGGWNKVGTVSVNVTLSQGMNTVRLSLGNGNKWMPDIDYMTIERINPDEKTFSKVNKSVNITVDGKTRSYWLYVPQDCPNGAPLVVAMHGASGHSSDNSPNFNQIADVEKCIVAYPQGEQIYFPVFGGTVTGWDASGEDNADAAFIKAIVNELAANYEIDRRRVYCCGFSNGGMNTYAMANACSDVFAAFASISGFPLNEFHLRHTGSRPVPFLHIHGKQDDFVRYSLMPTIVDEMVARMGACPVPVKTKVSGKYDKSVYEAMEGSFPYIYYEMDGMGHNDFTPNTEDGNSSLTMWKFFRQYTLDTPCDTTLKWRPRIETEGFAPKSHGWTVNSGTTLLAFGGQQNTSTNQNVYHSLQFTTGNYKLCFKSTGEAGKTITVKLQKLTGDKRLVVNTTVNVGEETVLPFKISGGWAEYKLTLSRAAATDDIAITDLTVYSDTSDASALRSPQTSASAKPVAEYSLSGTRQGQLRKGISLLRYDDGTVRKKLH